MSTLDQEPALQEDALRDAGCRRIYTDRVSGMLERRPELDRLLADLEAGDTLVVWRLDRLGRSLRNLIEVVGALEERGIGFRSLREAIDTTTPGGRLVFHLFGSLAEFERELIVERTRAGLAAARARGRTGGRRPTVTTAKLVQARRLVEGREHTMAEIAELLSVSRSALYRALRPPAQTAPEHSDRGTA